MFWELFQELMVYLLDKHSIATVQYLPFRLNCSKSCISQLQDYLTVLVPGHWWGYLFIKNTIFVICKLNYHFVCLLWQACQLVMHVIHFTFSNSYIKKLFVSGKCVRKIRSVVAPHCRNSHSSGWLITYQVHSNLHGFHTCKHYTQIIFIQVRMI